MSHSSRRIRQRRHGSGLGKFLLLGFLVVVLVCGLGAAAVAGWIIKTADSAPPLSTLKQKDPGSVSTVYAADGQRLGFIQANDLRPVCASGQIPEVLKQATVAIEDQRFYKHRGVDYEGILRAGVKNLENKKTVQGGSTLTMQLVRNLYTENYTRTGLAGLKRKLREAKLALELEKQHDKNWILRKYITSVPYGTVGGQTALGAGAAARMFFNKRIQDLTLNEAAML